MRSCKTGELKSGDRVKVIALVVGCKMSGCYIEATVVEAMNYDYVEIMVNGEGPHKIGIWHLYVD